MEKISLAFGRRVMDNMLAVASWEQVHSEYFDIPCYDAALAFHEGWLKAKAGVDYDDTLSYWWKKGWMEATADTQAG